MSARLPRRLSQNTNTCLEISRRNEEPAGRSQPLVQAIQIGLASEGISPGRPDGILGSKTQAAIEQFAKREGFDPTDPLEDVFVSLFGIRPDRLARLGLAKAKDCEKLALVPPPKRKKRISKRRKQRRTYDEDDYDENEAARDEAIDRTIGIGIGIGLGVLGEKMHRDGGKRRHRGKKDEYDHRKHKSYEPKWED